MITLMTNLHKEMLNAYNEADKIASTKLKVFASFRNVEVKTSFNNEEDLFQTSIKKDGEIIFHQNTCNDECFIDAFMEVFGKNSISIEIINEYFQAIEKVSLKI
jgi:hypothetical protein